MPNWILGPVDHRAEVWKVYPVQRIVVEAQAEWEARAQVAEAAPELHPANPWLEASQTTCEEITPPDVLAPPPWASRSSRGAGTEARTYR
jgi:hypothetical protein